MRILGLLLFCLFVFFWMEKDAFVLCRIFQKSGSGPKNGEQYGAPFIEEEWDKDEDVVVFVPGELAVEEVVAVHEPSDEAVDLGQVCDCSLCFFCIPFVPYSNEFSCSIEVKSKGGKNK